MTFDDGILSVYSKQNTAEKGDKPKYKLVLITQEYFGYDSISYNRLYTAIQANQQIDAVVRFWQNKNIQTNDVCIIDDVQYTVQAVQHTQDDDGLNITRLTLTRMEENYDISC